MNNFKVALLKDITDKQNAHLQGIKRVFISNIEYDTPLTQFAYGYMYKSQQSGEHIHVTMDEYFYFIKGKAIYLIDGNTIEIYPSTFVKIPANTLHNLINNEQETLEFVYFGIALTHSFYHK